MKMSEEEGVGGKYEKQVSREKGNVNNSAREGCKMI